MDGLEKLLLPQEVAEYLSVSEKTIYRWANQRILPAIKIAGQIRFRLSTVNRKLEELERPGLGDAA